MLRTVLILHSKRHNLFVPPKTVRTNKYSCYESPTWCFAEELISAFTAIKSWIQISQAILGLPSRYSPKRTLGALISEEIWIFSVIVINAVIPCMRVYFQRTCGPVTWTKIKLGICCKSIRCSSKELISFQIYFYTHIMIRLYIP